jgi:hypothetical protein
MPHDEKLQAKISTQYTWQLASNFTSAGYKKIIKTWG